MRFQALASSVRSPKSVVQFFLVAAGRVGHFRSQSRASKKPPKTWLTKIRPYGLISYVSQRNSYQGRRADQAGAGAGAGGRGNSPRVASGPSFASCLSFTSHQYHPANPAPSLKILQRKLPSTNHLQPNLQPKTAPRSSSAGRAHSCQIVPNRVIFPVSLPFHEDFCQNPGRFRQRDADRANLLLRQGFGGQDDGRTPTSH